MKKLNLCCGFDYKEGWVNADHKLAINKKDVEIDLEKLPLPFEDNTFDYIFSSHTLEHINREIMGVFVELWRVLKPNGILEIRVPHFSHSSALASPGHKKAFSIGSFFWIFEKEPYFFPSGFPLLEKPLFEKVNVELLYRRKDILDIPMKTNNKSYIFISYLIDRFANINHNFCERVWCYWVGGFTEMKIVMRKIPQTIKLEDRYFDKIIN
jgi:SAM-dependent methyltransferase